MDAVIQFLGGQGAMVLFVAILAKQIGLPIPAAPLLIAAGALAGNGQLSLGIAFASAMSAALLGDHVWYELGRRKGRVVLMWLCRLSFEATACVRRMEDIFTRHGMRSLIAAKFVPGLSTIAPPLAGIVGMRSAHYFFYNALGTAIWIGAELGLGYLLRDQLDWLQAVTSQIGPFLAVLTVAALGSYVVFRLVRRRFVERLVPRMTAERVTEKLAAGEDLFIVDLRSREARQDEAGIPGAVALSIENLLAMRKDFQDDRDTILYCACPGDAASLYAAWKLRGQGVTRVWPLAGGLGAWQALHNQPMAAHGMRDIHTVAA
ncbi:conserved membrane protein of unknown function [Nitrospira sp. KM1]|uniref:VTT domain-containing protein n=1 Tax=Nitrospira sp. KM1 TaxID=1936990 RepID=UPI0013A78367|nr:VTT domain-containing protein [Nitrospira sp. KM1]BCA55266.1 conserved membrane protein of unknown function [Nitrospira sp. KM1]